MPDWTRLAWGVAVVWAPGLAVAWAFLPRLDAPKFLFLSVVLAVTIVPALLYALNVFFGVALAPFNMALAALFVTSLALAWRARAHLERRWDS